MNALHLLLTSFVVVILVGCQGDPKSGRGFTLPEGDVGRGESTFTELRCYDCHSVTGVELPPAEQSDQKVVPLGGTVTRIKTYGELVTSIINPSHRLAHSDAASNDTNDEVESPMKNYNDVMTVNQLIDVVAFLQSHYVIREYEPTDYPPYYDFGP